MLPKNERLSRADFNRFFSVATRHHTPLFQLAYARHKALHVSIVVSKKIAPRAVDRNKMRRRMYDIVRRAKNEGRLRGVFIFIMRSEALRASPAALKETLDGTLTRIVR